MTMAASAPQKLTWEQAVVYARNTPEMAPLVDVCYYDDPIERAAARFKASEEWSAIGALLPSWPGRKVLEIGAGRGIVSWAFASEGCEVCAMEPDPSAIVGAGAIAQLTRATGAPIRIVESVGERLEFPDAAFDYVVCRCVLHHVTDLPQVCREIFRVLKPGGRFLAIKEHVAETPEELAQFLTLHPLNFLYGGEHAFPLATYLNALRGAGFVRLRNYGQFDHSVTSAPPFTQETIRGMMAGTLGRVTHRRFGAFVARSDALLHAYRRWLTFRCRTPGRLHSFLVEKPA